MKFIILSVPFLFFSLISGASDAQTQIKNVHDAVSASTPTGTRGIASDEATSEEQPVLTETREYGVNRNEFFQNQNVSLASGTETAFYPPSQPAARTKKKSTPAAPPPSEGVGTGE